MSFCADVKNEIALIKSSECCKIPLAYGFMLFGRAFSFKRISMQTNNENMAKCYSDVIKHAYSVTPKITVGGTVRPTYKAEISSEAERLMILASVDYGMNESFIDNSLFSRECCSESFIRGAFLSCGNINNPEKEYRAEFIVRSEKLAQELNMLLSNYGISLKTASRNKYTVLYTKDSSKIEDLLTLIGATHCSLNIMDTKIMKSVKNNINRQRNCDNGNISKTVEASIKQRTAIDYLMKTERLLSLPKELLNVAILRRDNPEATLYELCKLSSEPLTLSGINHRLSKIVEIYEENLNK